MIFKNIRQLIPFWIADWEIFAMYGVDRSVEIVFKLV